MKLALVDLDDTLCDTTNDLRGDITHISELTLLSGARETLSYMKFPKVLVTTGEKEIQLKKVSSLFLENCFEDIVVCKSDGAKRAVFLKCMKRFVVHNPRNVLVIGNRIDSEIRFGNMLGCTTVLIHHGKYRSLVAQDALEIPVHQVTSWADIRALLL